MVFLGAAVAAFAAARAPPRPRRRRVRPRAAAACEADASSSSDSDTEEARAVDPCSEGWWSPLADAHRVMRIDSVGAVDEGALQRMYGLFRTAIETYLKQAALEARYHRVNPTLSEQRAALLVEAIAGAAGSGRREGGGGTGCQRLSNRRTNGAGIACWLRPEGGPMCFDEARAAAQQEHGGTLPVSPPERAPVCRQCSPALG